MERMQDRTEMAQEKSLCVDNIDNVDSSDSEN